jgi:hypothetical protein
MDQLMKDLENKVTGWPVCNWRTLGEHNADH